MTYVGGTQVYAFRRLELQVGVIATNCWADIGGQHIVLSNDDIQAHDTQRARSISTHLVRRDTINRIDPGQVSNCQVVFRNEVNEVWICIPGVGEQYLTKARVYNTVTGEWGERALPNVAFIGVGLVPDDSGNSGTFDDANYQFNAALDSFDQAIDTVADDLLMLQPGQGRMLVVDRGMDDDAGQPITAKARKESFNLGDVRKMKFISEVWPRFVGNANDVVDIRLGGQDNFGDPVGWSVWQSFIIGQQPARLPVDVRGRYFSMEIRSVGGQRWRFYGMELVVVEMGEY